MTLDSAAAPEPAPAPEVGAMARIPGALFSPAKTFESIARRPTWLPPLVLWTIFSIAVTAVILPRVDYEKIIRASFERRGQTIPEDRLQSIVESQKRIAPKIYGAIAVVTPAIISLLIALVFWGAFKAFGWDATFQQSFGVTTHAFLPGILASVLLLPLIVRQETVDPQNLGDLLRSNLGFLVDSSSKVLHSLAQSIDLFSFWSLALLIVGFSAAARVSRKAAAGVIVTLWLLFVLGKAGLSALF
jgi:Yip1-like protein